MAIQLIYLSSKQKRNFLKKILLPADLLEGCWLWTGFIHADGYGQFRVDNKVHQAHRVSYYLHRKLPIPEQKDRKYNAARVIDHMCNNRKCCSPFHLQEVTQQINTIVTAGRGRSGTMLKDVQSILDILGD